MLRRFQDRFLAVLGLQRLKNDNARTPQSVPATAPPAAAPVPPSASGQPAAAFPSSRTFPSPTGDPGTAQTLVPGTSQVAALNMAPVIYGKLASFTLPMQLTMN